MNLFLKFFLEIFISALPIIKLILTPFMIGRYRFERQNIESVRLNNVEASFEVSSEGELEQTLPLIEKYLADNKEVLLFYCSKSVEERCLKLEQENHKLLQVFRLPLLQVGNRNFLNLVRGSKFYMCRYDFFPELIYYARQKKIKSVLISATLKNKSLEGLSKSFIRFLYSSFDEIYVADPDDIDKFKVLDLIVKGPMDLRIIRIQKRLRETYESKPQLIINFLRALERTNPCENFIFGSFYFSETEFLSNEFINKLQDKFKRIFIAPHNLNKSELDNISQFFSDYEAITYKVDTIIDFNHEKRGIFILDIKGILCELYQFMSHVYIGGGFGRSIHSVLEPYTAGVHQILCGPMVQKSTEYSLIERYSSSQIKIINRFTFEDLKFDNEAVSKVDEIGELTKKNLESLYKESST